MRLQKQHPRDTQKKTKWKWIVDFKTPQYWGTELYLIIMHIRRLVVVVLTFMCRINETYSSSRPKYMLYKFSRNNGMDINIDIDLAVSVWNINSFSLPSKNRSKYQCCDEKSNLQIYIDTRTGPKEHDKYKNMKGHELHFNSFMSNTRKIVILKK